MWLGGEYQEARLGYERSGCKCEGQAKDSGVRDHQGIEARVEGLMLMDQVQL